MIIDSHCHLTDERLYPIVDDIVNGLNANGIESVITVGYDLPSSTLGVDVARRYKEVYATVGMHPGAPVGDEVGDDRRQYVLLSILLADFKHHGRAAFIWWLSGYYKKAPYVHIQEPS